MTKEKFAKLFFKEAKRNNLVFTTKGNIKCSNGKNISITKLEKIFELEGKQCIEAKSKTLKSVGIETCCFNVFKLISNSIFNKVGV